MYYFPGLLKCGGSIIEICLIDGAGHNKLKAGVTRN